MSYESHPRPPVEGIEHVPTLPVKEFLALLPDKQAEMTTRTYEELRSLFEANGFSETTDITEMYASLPQETMIVRRENPDAIESLLTSGSYPISFVGDTEYANCVEWKPTDGAMNLRNTYIEGFSQKNGVVAVVGIRTAAVGLSTKRLESSHDEYYGLDRRGVRSTSGTVTSQDILFVSVRVPITHLPDELLTPDEQERKHEFLERVRGGQRLEPLFIHRGYRRTLQ